MKLHNLRKAVPYFNLLIKTHHTKRGKLLHLLPEHVAQTIIELMYNIVNERIPLRQPTHFDTLKQNKARVLQIVEPKSPKTQLRTLYKQNGGFLGAILPILVSVVGSLLGR